MAPPTPLSIATSSVLRLVKEEASYHRELEQQTQRLQKSEAEAANAEDTDGNRDYLLRQERQAVEETKAVFPSLKVKIQDAVAKLEVLLVEEGQKGSDSNVEQINAAKDAVSRAKTAIREVA